MKGWLLGSLKHRRICKTKQGRHLIIRLLIREDLEIFIVILKLMIKK